MQFRHTLAARALVQPVDKGGSRTLLLRINAPDRGSEGDGTVAITHS